MKKNCQNLLKREIPLNMISSLCWNEFTKVFLLFDVDASGNLDSKEFLAILKKFGLSSVSNSEVATLTTFLDQDGDGSISLKEFRRALWNVIEPHLKSIPQDSSWRLYIHQHLFNFFASFKLSSNFNDIRIRVTKYI